MTSRPYKSKTRWFEIIPTRRGAFSGSSFPRSRLIPCPLSISLRRAVCVSEIASRCIQRLDSSRKHRLAFDNEDQGLVQLNKIFVPLGAFFLAGFFFFGPKTKWGA